MVGNADVRHITEQSPQCLALFRLVAHMDGIADMKPNSFKPTLKL